MITILITDIIAVPISSQPIPRYVNMVTEPLKNSSILNNVFASSEFASNTNAITLST